MITTKAEVLNNFFRSISIPINQTTQNTISVTTKTAVAMVTVGLLIYLSKLTLMVEINE